MSETMNTSPGLPYRPGLDGLRAIAVLGVLFFHLQFPWALGGYLGVETFILISGYLITSLLLEDYRANGRLNLKRFWLRRIRRLWPALWLLLMGVLVLGFTIAPQNLPRLKEDVPAAVFYVTNWVYIIRDIPYFEGWTAPPLLQHLWSLAIEEQFYLFWPLIIWASLRLWKVKKGSYPSRWWLIFPVGLAALSAGLMVGVLGATGDTARAYYGTDTRAFGFLLGGALAVLWPLTKPKELSPSAKVAAALSGGIGAIGLLWLYNSVYEFTPWLYPWGFLLTDLFTILMIIAAVQPKGWWERVLGFPVLRWIGTRSYAIYLWHWPLVALFRPGAECRWPGWVCALGHITLTLLLAEWSYQVVENPIRREGFRAWWKGLRGRTWQLVGFPLLLLAAAGFISWRPWNAEISPPLESPTPSTLVVSIENTATPVPEDTQEPAAASTPVPTQGAPEWTATIPFTPPATPTPRWTCYVTLIGDSVMARTYSTWMAENNIYFQFWVDATVKRQAHEIVPLLHSLRGGGHLYPAVVLHTGTNGMYSASTLNSIIAEMSGLGVRQVYLINVRVPKGWEGLVNEYIEGVADDWPDLVTLVDWHTVSGEHPDWFLDDGVHLTEVGAQAYVDLTLDTIRENDCIP